MTLLFDCIMESCQKEQAVSFTGRSFSGKIVMFDTEETDYLL